MPPPAVPGMDDATRLRLVRFMMAWLSGDMMSTPTVCRLATWRELATAFPHRLSGSVRLHRVVTLPIDALKDRRIRIDRPSAGTVGSWTSTLRGLDCVAGIANELVPDDRIADTARIGITAEVDAGRILMDFAALRRAFLSLTADYEHGDFVLPATYRLVDGIRHYDAEAFRPWLGEADALLHSEISYLQGLFRDMPGGPYRQREHIVVDHPVEATVTYVYRRGTRHLRQGHDDPHNI